MGRLIAGLRTDRRVNPLGIDSSSPEFSWHIPGDAGQAACEVEVAQSPRFEGQAVWRSGRLDRAAPFGIRYQGDPLLSLAAYFWRARAWLDDGSETGWSETARFETGPLTPADWKAAWITDPWSEGDASARTLYFRTDLGLPAPVTRGRAFASALGWYRLLVNGADITGHDQVPRWTPFDQYVEFQAYDVTDAFGEGPNVIAMVVSEGRFRGHNGGFSKAAMYGTRLAAFLQVRLELADGTSVTLATGEGWTVETGRVASADPKFGERVDLRVSADAWMAAAPGGNGRSPVRVLPPHPRRLVAEQTERVTDVGRLPGLLSRAPSGDQLIDFGQNFAGVARIRLRGPEGGKVIISYGEVLTTGGELDTSYLETGKSKSLEGWFQRDEVTLGGRDETYSPAFTVRGFRYVAVRGPARPLAEDDVEGIVLSTSLRQTGRFTASDRRLERLHSNVMWSLRSNFGDTPMDCPTRERSGWTGDIQVFGPTASILVDCDSYLRRYLRNAVAEQYPDGRIPHVVPKEPSPLAGLDIAPVTAESTGWGDVITMLPMTLYQYYGDAEVLRQCYGAARAWVEFLRSRAARRNGRRYRHLGASQQYLIETGYDWGEWLRPGENPWVTGAQSLLGARNILVRPHSVVATAYFAHSAGLLSEMARTLGIDDDAGRYSTLAAAVRAAWRAAFVRARGWRIGDDKQDDYVRALAFNLVEPAERQAATGRLLDLVEFAGDHLATGFLSTPLLLHVLADNGHPEVAYRVLLQMTSPSWLGQVERGATTVWESWEGYDKSGRARGSHNHYALGSVARWLHEYVAGLRPAAPGYREIMIAPVIGGGLTSASRSVQTPYGEAASAWRVAGDRVELDATIPPGTSGFIRLGDGTTRKAGPGQHHVSWAATGSRR